MQTNANAEICIIRSSRLVETGGNILPDTDGFFSAGNRGCEIKALCLLFAGNCLVTNETEPKLH